MKRKKKYAYMVSYFHKNGNGCSQILRDTKIKTLEDFEGLRSYIQERNELENVAIINYILIGKQQEDKGCRISELPEDPESKVKKSICEYKKLTEEEALEKLNNQESITKEEARDILFSLCDAVKERAENLPERVVSSWDYYKGEFNGMDVAIRLFSKLK